MLEVKWKVISFSFFMMLIYVSILVMLEVKWKALYLEKRKILLKVSILVMLEVKWKALSGAMTSEYGNSFNPCYVGSKMESIPNR